MPRRPRPAPPIRAGGPAPEALERAILDGEQIPLLAPALDALLARGLPPSPLLALSWTLGHGKAVAGLPPERRAAGATAAHALAIARALDLRQADPSETTLLHDPSLRWTCAPQALRLRSGLPAGLPLPSDLARLAALLDAARLADPTLPVPPADPAPAPRPPETPQDALQWSALLPRLPTPPLPPRRRPPALAAVLDAALQDLPLRPVEACLRAERRIAASPAATLQRILSDVAPPPAVRRYRAARAALLPSLTPAPPSEEAMAVLREEGAAAARAMAEALAKTLSAGATAATVEEFLGTILQIDVDPPEGSPATLARTNDLRGLLPVLADALARRPELLPALEAAAAIGPPTRLPLLAASPGVAAWISAEGEIRIARRTDAPPPAIPALLPLALTLDGERSEMPSWFRDRDPDPALAPAILDALRRAARQAEDGVLRLPDLRSAHARLSLEASPDRLLLRRRLDADEIRFRQDGPVLAVHIPDRLLLLLPA